MKCGEFRTWFEKNLRGEVPSDWPREEYRKHLVRCQRCRLLLSVDDIGLAIAEIAAVCPGPGDGATEEALAIVHRRAARLRFLRGGAAITLLLAVVGGLIAFYPRDTAPACGPDPAARESAARIPAEIDEDAMRVSFARSLESDGFRLRSNYFVKQSGMLVLSYEKVDPEGDAYEFVKAAALANFDVRFPKAPGLSIVVSDGEKGLLGVVIQREALAAARESLSSLPGAEACRRFKVLYDTEGRALSTEEDEE